MGDVRHCKKGDPVFTKRHGSIRARNGWLYRDVEVVTTDSGRSRRLDHDLKFYVTYTGQKAQGKRDSDIFPNVNKPTYRVVLDVTPKRLQLSHFQRLEGLVKIRKKHNKSELEYLTEQISLLKSTRKEEELLVRDMVNGLHTDNFLSLQPKRGPEPNTWISGPVINEYLRLVLQDLQCNGQDLFVMPTGIVITTH